MASRDWRDGDGSRDLSSACRTAGLDEAKGMIFRSHPEETRAAIEQLMR
jgi:hypothetical protein